MSSAAAADSQVVSSRRVGVRRRQALIRHSIPASSANAAKQASSGRPQCGGQNGGRAAYGAADDTLTSKMMTSKIGHVRASANAPGRKVFAYRSRALTTPLTRFACISAASSMAGLRGTTMSCPDMAEIIAATCRRAVSAASIVTA